MKIIKYDRDCMNCEYKNKKCYKNHLRIGIECFFFIGRFGLFILDSKFFKFRNTIETSNFIEDLKMIDNTFP